MHIAVDARQLFRQNRRGIGKSLRLMLMHLSKQNPTWRFDLYHRHRSVDSIDLELGPYLTPQFIDMFGDRYSWWERFRLPIAVSASHADLLYCPANTSPAFGLTPSVVSIHDLIPLEMVPHLPETISWARSVKSGAKRSKKVHTVSAYTADCLMRNFGLLATKIEVIPQAADPAFIKIDDLNALRLIRAKYSIPSNKSYVIAFGAEDPRKNTKRIIDAWSRLSSAIHNQYNLVIIGVQSSYIDIVKRYASTLLTDESCLISGFADEIDLPGLISGAEVLCYPSISEGFGLPVLEAFGCKTAVITSNNTSLIEVAGEDALLVDPDSTESIAQSLELILSDDDLRYDYKSRGYTRSLRYNWTQIAKDFASLFSSI